MSRLRSAVVFLGSLIVGGTFVAAGALKSLDVDGFAHDIALHGILPAGPSALLARILIPLEIVAGAAAIIGFRRRAALAVLMAALIVFMAATGYAWSRGNTEGCGCFGRFAARTPLSVIVEDALLLVLAAAAFLLAERGGSRIFKDRAPSPAPRPEGSDTPASAGPSMPAPTRIPDSIGSPTSSGIGGAGWRILLLVVLGLASTAFTIASPWLPLDNLATALRPGVTLTALGLDSIAGNLADGDRLLVVLVLDEPRTQSAIPALNELAQGSAKPLTGLTSANETQRAEFFWTQAPAFDLLEVPASDLRRLYRKAPRTFRVHNGRVLQVWDGVPHVKELDP